MKAAKWGQLNERSTVEKAQWGQPNEHSLISINRVTQWGKLNEGRAIRAAHWAQLYEGSWLRSLVPSVSCSLTEALSSWALVRPGLLPCVEGVSGRSKLIDLIIVSLNERSPISGCLVQAAITLSGTERLAGALVIVHNSYTHIM